MFTESGGGGSGVKSMLGKQVGPMPMWAWMGLGLGGALAYASWRRNKQDAAKAPTDVAVEEIGGDQRPPYVFQAYTTVNTPITVPPGAGRETPPVPAPTPGPAPTPSPAPTGPPSPGPSSPGPSTPPPAPSGTWVQVGRWTSHNPPWNSTLWGIARQYGYGAGGNNWQAVWNNPANATLRARRKTPTLIQPGDRVFVPAR